MAGCKYENCDGLLHACHQVIDDASELPALFGSKYVQSETDGVYPKVKKTLADGRDVLFSGTPCQITGLRGYLGEKLWGSEHLVTVDLVCHGAPNQRILQEYLSGLGESSSQGLQVVDVRFRPKRDGWSDSLRLELVFEDGSREYIASEKSSYYDAFLKVKTLS